ncbi:hypothetical protein MHYP_G00333140 [Metynnis hypsauchen]
MLDYIVKENAISHMKKQIQEVNCKEDKMRELCWEVVMFIYNGQTQKLYMVAGTRWRCRYSHICLWCFAHFKRRRRETTRFADPSVSAQHSEKLTSSWPREGNRDLLHCHCPATSPEHQEDIYTKCYLQVLFSITSLTSAVLPHPQ